MNWVRHGGSTTFETKSSYLPRSTARVAVLHGSSTTWFQTSRYCRAKVEFNSINLVRHGSRTTFETGLTFRDSWLPRSHIYIPMHLAVALTRSQITKQKRDCSQAIAWQTKKNKQYSGPFRKKWDKSPSHQITPLFKRAYSPRNRGFAVKR